MAETTQSTTGPFAYHVHILWNILCSYIPVITLVVFAMEMRFMFVFSIALIPVIGDCFLFLLNKGFRK